MVQPAALTLRNYGDNAPLRYIMTIIRRARSTKTEMREGGWEVEEASSGALIALGCVRHGALAGVSYQLEAGTI